MSRQMERMLLEVCADLTAANRFQQETSEEKDRRILERGEQQTNESNGFSKKQWACIGVIGALLILAAAIVGVCESRNCRCGIGAKSQATTSPEQEASPSTVQTTTETTTPSQLQRPAVQLPW